MLKRLWTPDGPWRGGPSLSSETELREREKTLPLDKSLPLSAGSLLTSLMRGWTSGSPGVLPALPSVASVPLPHFTDEELSRL